MRRDRNLTNVSLVINNVPDNDVLGCQKNLQDILPRGTTVAVYVTDHNGLHYWG